MNYQLQQMIISNSITISNTSNSTSSNNMKTLRQTKLTILTIMDSKMAPPHRSTVNSNTYPILIDIPYLILCLVLSLRHAIQVCIIIRPTSVAPCQPAPRPLPLVIMAIPLNSISLNLSRSISNGIPWMILHPHPNTRHLPYANKNCNLRLLPPPPIPSSSSIICVFYLLFVYMFPYLLITTPITLPSHQPMNTLTIAPSLLSLFLVPDNSVLALWQ